jgi:fumarylacetoacetase
VSSTGQTSTGDPPAWVAAYGIGAPATDGSRKRALARFGDQTVDLDHLQSIGTLRSTGIPEGVFSGPSLNAFMALGPAAWRALDEYLFELVQRGAPPEALHPISSVRLFLPFEVADYCDFYASEYHASNMGRILRPGSDPLPAAWHTIPIGYHGRAGTILVSGTPVSRPAGVIAAAGGAGDGPGYAPSRRLDLEVELGYVVGVGSAPGEPVGAGQAHEHIFGVVVVNDWSARDIQSFEYQPLGPFLGKSFATSISPWVVRLDALRPLRTDGPDQGADAPPHLSCPQPRAIDIELELSVGDTVLSRPKARHLYWSPEQFVAHLTSNGASLRTGDLLATGTISGPGPESWGSLMELSWGGERPVPLGDGTERAWLEDGDTVIIRARGGSAMPFDIGEVVGTIESPARNEEAVPN